MKTAIVPYDDRDGLIWMDGEFVPWREARVHFLTYTLQYGNGIFEGLRSYGGNIFKLHEHSQRLLAGCRTINLRLPYTLDEINKACLDVIAANKISDGYIRPLAWCGAEQISLSAGQTKPHLAVAAWEWPSYFGGDAGSQGIRLQIARWQKPSPKSAPVNIKASGLYIISSLAKQEAEIAGYDDALMLDYQGRIAELSSANFFMVRNDALYTPREGCFLNGITRQTIIELASESGLSCYEADILPEEIAGFDECFATGTAIEIVPISAINDSAYEPGPVTRFLQRRYREAVTGLPQSAEFRQAA